MSNNNKFQEYTYDYLMQTALSFVADDKDKRQGSVVYDCLGPFCQLLAAGAMELRNFYLQTYAMTASGENLDNRVAEHNIVRYPATYAVKRIDLVDRKGEPAIAPLGVRLSTVSDANPINYELTAYYTDPETGEIVPGSYEATCEQAGTVGNEYSGNVINISFVQGLAKAYMTELLVPARDVETDEALLIRYLEAINENPFGGNIADYKRKLKAIDGIGAFQIYPVWEGGGTVKLCIVDTNYNKCTDDFILKVQNDFDPENIAGEKGTGLGLAPIGHKVTVTTPNELDINIEVKLTLNAGVQLSSVQDNISKQVQDYIEEVRHEWADASDLNQYASSILRAKIVVAIMSVKGVNNVTIDKVKLNGKYEDLILEQSNYKQEIPIFRAVNLIVE